MRTRKSSSWARNTSTIPDGAPGWTPQTGTLRGPRSPDNNPDVSQVPSATPITGEDTAVAADAGSTGPRENQSTDADVPAEVRLVVCPAAPDQYLEKDTCNQRSRHLARRRHAI
jgi:hypothetical protein